MSVYISICICIIYLSTHPSITLSIIYLTIIYLLFNYHYSSTYLSILLIFANITTQRKPLRELAPYFPNHITGTDTFGRDLIYKFLKVLQVADHYYVKTQGRTQIQISSSLLSCALQANLQEKKFLKHWSQEESLDRA